jgi:uncharacterized protein (TIGR00369 family)
MAGERTGPVDPRLERIVRDVLMASPVACRLGIALESLEADRAVLELPFSPGNVTLGDTVHGGVIATLIDVAAAAVAASGADPETLAGGATASMTISYLAPARGSHLRAEAVTLRRGRRQVVSEVTVHGEGVPLAKALVTSALF